MLLNGGYIGANRNSWRLRLSDRQSLGTPLDGGNIVTHSASW
jgi:hypothetical protein